MQGTIDVHVCRARSREFFVLRQLTDEAENGGRVFRHGRAEGHAGGVK